jgi:multidrug efflux pump subunit AcrA (membrane-fusion protein)
MKRFALKGFFRTRNSMIILVLVGLAMLLAASRGGNCQVAPARGLAEAASSVRTVHPHWETLLQTIEQPFSGRVARSSWLLDNQARTLRTEIDLPNSEGNLRPGMYAPARLIVEHPRTLTVPSSAVFHQDDQDWVIQVVRGNAVRTPVKLGLRAGNNIEVLRKQIFPVSVGEPTAWEDFTGWELVVRENPSALADRQQVQFLDGDSTVTAHRENPSATTMPPG